MLQNKQFYLDGFLLKILDSAYLVELEPANGNAGCYTDSTNLPKWIFHSPHAIWLMKGDAPVFDRARQGDEIRNSFLKKGVNHDESNQNHTRNSHRGALR